VLGHLQSFIPLAPLHEPHNVAGIIALQALLPTVPQIACFDTAFHRSQPEVAQTFGLPRASRPKASSATASTACPTSSSPAPCRSTPPRQRPRRRRPPGQRRQHGAMVDRKCVATTLGFSTIDGLMMGTRCGNLDPGVILHLMETKG
jgi:acetate kinase